jgi:hypothetical protein
MIITFSDNACVFLFAWTWTGFFPPTIPVDNLMPYVAAIPYFAKKRLHNPVIVSPSAGGVNRAKKFRDHFLKTGIDASYASSFSKLNRTASSRASNHIFHFLSWTRF